jgi:hypothetical protein
LSVIEISQQLTVIGFELEYKTVFFAQPADVELIFERVVVVFHSESLCDFHREIIMNTESLFRPFARFPVVLTFGTCGVVLVVTVYGPGDGADNGQRIRSL